MHSIFCLIAATAVHAIGNGSALFYTENADIIDMYGPGYSTPPIGRMVVAEPASGLECSATRIEKTNTFVTSVESPSGRAVMTDAVDPEYDVFVREFETSFPIRYELANFPNLKRYRFSDSLCIVTPVSTPYNGQLLASAKESRLYLTVDGDAELADNGVLLHPGKGRIVITLTNPVEGEGNLAFAAKRAGEVFARSASYWNGFFGEGEAVRSAIDPAHPLHDEIVRTLYSVPALIHAQQSRSGGVMAGRYYPMAYIRDQAGVLKGLLAMGYASAAEKIVRFWLGRFERFGDLVTAEVMNGEEGRMIFNDDVEGPSYIMESVFELAKVRPEILAECKPMLDWALKAQLRQLHKGMTCFSGDETYVAGAILQRAYLYHGSSDSTGRFIRTAERYIELFGGDGELREKVAEARALFRENFVRDGIVYVNQPWRMEGLEFPRWQDGVCIRCWYDGSYGRLKTLEYDPVSGYHVCPDCFGKPIANLPEIEMVALPCVSLMTGFVDGGFVTEEEFRSAAGNSTLDPRAHTGYDFAMRLNALARAGLDTASALAGMMSARDADGAWCEYYRDGKQSGCPCRPWESALNCEAMLNTPGVKR